MTLYLPSNDRFYIQTLDLEYLQQRQGLQSFYTWNECLYIMYVNGRFATDSLTYNICISIDALCLMRLYDVHSVLRECPSIYLLHCERGMRYIQEQAQGLHSSDTQFMKKITVPSIYRNRNDYRGPINAITLSFERLI